MRLGDFREDPDGGRDDFPSRRRLLPKNPPKALILATLRFYQRFVSPLKPPTCRFRPVCSTYAVEAIELHGVLKGCWLAVRRLARCHPFHPGGHDPVPGLDDGTGPDDPAGRPVSPNGPRERPFAEER
jgi:putative membrane protein insertion efficiency factor